MSENIQAKESWVSTKEICEHLSVSRHSVNNWIVKCGMPAHKVGGRWRFKISEIDEWVKSCEASLKK